MVEKEMMKDAIREVMAEGVFVSQETHEKHHRWLETQILRAEQCVDNRRKITNFIVGAVAVSAISWVASLIWAGFKAGL